MEITATELKQNLGKYLNMAKTEDIYIVKNGHVIAKITAPYEDRVAIAESLFGTLPSNAMVEDGKEERFKKLCEF